MTSPHSLFLRLLALCLVPSFLFADDLEDDATDVLFEVLETSGMIKQVHAAEILLRYGHTEEIYEHFRPFMGQYDDVPIDRVVLNRVLVRSTPSVYERATYIDNLARIAATPGLPDRVHAGETLGKLGVPAPDYLVHSLASWAILGPEKDAMFGMWADWDSYSPEIQTELLVRWFASDEEDMRLRGVYILRFADVPTAKAMDALAAVAERSLSEINRANTLIVAIAYAQRADPERLEAWEAYLESAIATGEESLIYHGLQGLMTGYDEDDLAKVLPLYDHEGADARAAAAWTVLHVLARSGDD